jgi:anti-sigma factor RsiW
MKTFEEKWTAWVDDELTGDELVAFEASLPDKTTAQAEKKAAHQLRSLLQRELHAPAMANEEFFSHQLRERMARDEEAEVTRSGGDPSPWWTIGRLLWTGAASLALFLVCAVLVLRDKNPEEQSQYLTEILTAKVDPVGAPDATVSMFESKGDRVTVLWTEGLKSLPSDYAAK